MVKKLLKSVHIYRSYRQNKPGGPFFWNTRYNSNKTAESNFGKGHVTLMVIVANKLTPFCSLAAAKLKFTLTL